MFLLFMLLKLEDEKFFRSLWMEGEALGASSPSSNLLLAVGDAGTFESDAKPSGIGGLTG
jgi:hypothetical protein